MTGNPLPDRQAQEVARLLGERRLACAESCTAGIITQALAAQEGSGDWLRGGLVAYQTDVKHALLGVDSPVFSCEAAEQMARGAAELFDVAAVVATTGVAGPDPQDDVDAGTTFIGWYVDGEVGSERHYFEAQPADVCSGTAAAALEGLAAALRRAGGPSAEQT